MTAAERAAFELLVGTGLTQHPTDNARAVLIIRAASPEDRADVVRLVMDRRASWKAWLTRTQRQWQRQTRNPNKARHHDSIEIRERYVRCS
jgi:hypothetical protein